MRIFQNSGVYASYLPRLDRLAKNDMQFQKRLKTFLNDSYGACHILKPPAESTEDVFFTNGDDERLQKFWAAENGLPNSTTMEEILLAQIEHHRTEIFYNMDPMRYGSEFLKKLPGCVRKSIMWRAAPSGNVDFGAYDLIICNFPLILEGYRKRGWHAEYFAPAHDPAMDQYAANTNRPIDVLFVGGYTRHHRKRAEVLEAVSELCNEFRIVFHLDRSRLTRLAESPIGWLPPISKHKRPRSIRAVSQPAVFGRDLYKAISHSKIVLNGAVDMAGPDRGNMRCWETLGCGAAMVSDAGNYPHGMIDGESMVTYDNTEAAVSVLRELLADRDRLLSVAARGHTLVKTMYNKEAQWQHFNRLIEIA
ncbi:glycosyltransferase family protein [Rhizobium sp. GCM10022189]|uniref:glycosyltransferase family protein n=1 Tax=Rhizobium sp. GCM10022189 TaxID=3252654 RepID=UPI000DDC8B8D